MLANYIIGQAKTQSGALADIFGRKERIKNLVQMLLGDAATIILNRDVTLPVIRPSLDFDCP